MLMSFEPGQGVVWRRRNLNDVSYGIVMGEARGGLEVAPVCEADADTTCYDEDGAKYSLDHHNVRIQGCPPPFTQVWLEHSDYGLYVNADPSARVYFDKDAILARGLDVVDGGKLVPQPVLDVIRNHPWPEKDHSMRDIVKLDADLYLVHGRVIGCLDPGLFDADTPEGKAILIDVADRTCRSRVCPRSYGPLTVFYFCKAPKITGGRFLMANQEHFIKLPDAVKVILRKELPEYADEF